MDFLAGGRKCAPRKEILQKIQIRIRARKRHGFFLATKRHGFFLAKNAAWFFFSYPVYYRILPVVSKIAAKIYITTV